MLHKQIIKQRFIMKLQWLFMILCKGLTVHKALVVNNNLTINVSLINYDFITYY